MFKKNLNLSKLIITFFIFCSIFLIASNKTNQSYQINNNDNSVATNTEDDNIYTIAKPDTLYEVKTLRKTGNDKNKINVLLLGDNYSFQDSDDSFFNTMYERVITPWLSSPMTTDGSIFDPNHQHTIEKEILRGTRNPYQTFLNDKINVYSIQPDALNYNESITDGSKSFFGSYASSNVSSSWLQVPNWGKIKKNVLSYDVSKNFLEDDGIINGSTAGIIRKLGNVTANATLSDYYRATTDNLATIHMHEMGHSIWGLTDEYPDTTSSGNNINRAYISDPENENSIPWKEFLNFRGIGLYKTKNNNVFLPADECIMHYGTYATAMDFCEVCMHHIVTTGAKATNSELFYIADPELTTVEGKPKYNDPTTNVTNPYSVDNISSKEVNWQTITLAKDKHLELRTVIDNITSKTRKIKFRITLKDKNTFFEESEVFVIKPNELKGLSFKTSKTCPSGLTSKDSISGEIVDAETNEVLATNNDRVNRHYYGTSYLRDYIGKRQYKVTINFKNKETNESLPNVKPTILVKRDGSKFKLEKILFNGYRLDPKKSKIDNKELVINKADQTFNYYYDPLPYKNLKLKLIDTTKQANNLEKIVKVYEGQKFIPKSSDFFAFNLDSLDSANPNLNNTWNESIVPPKTVLNYDQIQDNITELVYTKSSQKPIYHLTKNVETTQGNNNYNFKNYDKTLKPFFTKSFKSNFEEFGSNYNIIFNNVNYEISGEYQIVYFYGNNVSEIEKNKSLINKVKVTIKPNTDPNYNQNSVQGEIEKLNANNLIIMDKFEKSEASLSDFENITKNNLLQNISNFDLDNKNFSYEVVDFSKTYKQESLFSNYGYKFKIKISSNNKNISMTTREFEKHIYLKDDKPVEPPISDEILLNQEINRINSIDLKLSKNEFTQEEINSIDENNFVDQLLNWNSVVGDKSKFSYQISNFDKKNNKFSFNVKVILNNDLSKIKETKIFQVDYTIKTLIDQNLKNEKNRIDELQLSLKTNQFTQEELNNLVKNPDSFVEKINGWNSVESKFDYKFIIENKQQNQIKLNVQIIEKNSQNYLTSKDFIFDYELINNNNLKNNNELYIVLLPSLIIFVVTILTIFWFAIHKKMKKNKNI
ncbi:hypothetical protein [Mycoplasmoides pirum]|uniref:hypothetical protein n=1 Tax=Mycoplasmoides pirum TaxID=2122 RepID=UPI0004898514|nr:hypothetical protein [Mycoplasmoides pirum]